MLCKIGSHEMEAKRESIAYFYDADIGSFVYGPAHPMKPHRVRMTHDLVVHYGLGERMQIFRPRLLLPEEMKEFHAEEYVSFLSAVNPACAAQYKTHCARFNMGDDCTIFDGLFRYCQITAGGSVGGAVKLNQESVDVAVNWSGGLHHAKKAEASGFCYINDIVLAILELLKIHPRVMYIDIDVHHGDGVEEAFYTTDRVMTVSFHKYGEFYPGTGSIKDHGVGKGKYYSINFPLLDGIDDETFQFFFQMIVAKAVQVYQPTAIVMQCGADSLTQDRLGCFNLTLVGHGSCIEFVRQFELPLLILGGGGYTIRNVSRCWTYETALLIDSFSGQLSGYPSDAQPGSRKNVLSNQIPKTNFFHHYGPLHTLHLDPSPQENKNSIEYLRLHTQRILENLRQIESAPCVVGDSNDNHTIDNENQQYTPTSIRGLRDRHLFAQTHSKGEDRPRITQRMRDNRQTDLDDQDE
ncbi:MAG: putative Histone deacetylase 1 [Streblomastix strix]|uniref:Histone deacetylase n=1 Tax=Streblomastix strix TaxID=222440 RepID=A0A5J4X6J2_9EUKA|nr:MAG: putative Histone deacetylase 1 [Streblomastix strix]